MSTWIESDFELETVEAAGGGDPGASRDLAEPDRHAIDQLYRRYGATLRRFIRARVRSETEAEDVLQDVFLRICRRGDLESLQSPGAVLFKTSFRLSLNAIRRRKSSPIDGGCEVERLELPNADRSPEEALIVRQMMESLSRSFGALPAQCRRVLSLRTVDGLSYEEMSAQLGLSISTLEKHVVKGRRILREHRAASGDTGGFAGSVTA